MSTVTAVDDALEPHDPHSIMASSRKVETQDTLGEDAEGAPSEAMFNTSSGSDLQMDVDNPQKHVTPFETYITYCITTKTSRAEYDAPEFVVRRRYSDFEWLRLQLTHSHPARIIPPLPEKHSLFEQIDRYDKRFIEGRMQLLKRFLNRVADHPLLSRDHRFKGFLVEPQNEFSVMRKVSQPPGLLARVTESLQSMATSYVAKERTAEFEKVHEYLCKLAEKIHTMEKIGQRVQKERSGYCQEISQLQPIMTQWAQSEPVLRNGLLAVGEAAATCADAQRKLIEDCKSNFTLPLHEYGLYVEAAKAALNYRDGAQIDFEVHSEQLSRVKAEQNQLQTRPLSDQPVMFGLNVWRSPEEVQQQRLQQLSTASTALSQQVETSREKMECCNETFREDFERFNMVKTLDIKAMLVQLADHHIQSYEKSLVAWTAVLPTVKSDVGDA